MLCPSHLLVISCVYPSPSASGTYHVPPCVCVISLVDHKLLESRQYPDGAQSLVPSKQSLNTYLIDSACCSYVEWTGLKMLTIQTPFKQQAFLEVQLDIAGQINRNQRLIQISVIHWATTHQKVPSLPQEGMLSYCLGALCHSQQEQPLCLQQSSRPVGTPHRIWASRLCPSQGSL